jgi:predicted dienelactone hydrolase
MFQTDPMHPISAAIHRALEGYVLHRMSLTLFVILIPLLYGLAHAAPPAVIGFQQRQTEDGTEIGIWYPASGTPAAERLGPYEQTVVRDAAPAGSRHPLIVISHGSGGSFSGHHDTAEALAEAGFVVAALTHPGDNWQDQSKATEIESRPAALSALITYMLRDWPSHGVLDPVRVGAFGFSAGGFTVLAAAGGKPDLSRIGDHCGAHPDFFDCMLIKSHPRGAVSWSNVMDQRIKAIVVAAPALGFTFDKAGLAAVTVPVQLWRADDDHILPAPFYADAVRSALPGAVEFHEVQGAGHFDFLAPCAKGAPALVICASAPGFDRIAFHERFNAEIVGFFQKKL